MAALRNGKPTDLEAIVNGDLVISYYHCGHLNSCAPQNLATAFRLSVDTPTRTLTDLVTAVVRFTLSSDLHSINHRHIQRIRCIHVLEKSLLYCGVRKIYIILFSSSVLGPILIFVLRYVYFLRTYTLVLGLYWLIGQFVCPSLVPRKAVSC